MVVINTERWMNEREKQRFQDIVRREHLGEIYSNDMVEFEGNMIDFVELMSEFDTEIHIENRKIIIM